MKNKLLSIFILVVYFLSCFNSFVLADLQIQIDENYSAEDYNDMMSCGVPDMQPFYDDDGKFKEVRYFVKSTGSNSGIKYRTKEFIFKVGEYGYATIGAEQLRERLPNNQRLGELLPNRALKPVLQLHKGLGRKESKKAPDES